jgi:hypothetical protein
MAAAASFEVQLQRKGRWETLSQHGEFADAETKAKAIQNSPQRVDGVRVVRETFDPDTNRFATSVLFRWVRGEAEQREQQRQATEAETRVQTVLQNARAARLAADRKRLERAKSSWFPALPFWFWPFVGLVAAAVAGIFGLIGLHTLLYS